LQTLGVVAPVKVEKEPAEQLVHRLDEDPVATRYVPATQLMQLACPALV